MNDVLDIVDPGWNFNFTIGIFGLLAVALVAAGVALLLSLILRGRYRKERLRDFAGSVAFAGVIAFVACLFVFGIWGTYDYYGKVENAKIAAMQDLGYTNVKFNDGKYEDENRFVASVEGKYFEGSLVEDGDLRWQVVELTAKG